MSAAWTAQATVTACLTAFLYEGFTYNAVYLGRVLPAVGKDDQVTPLLIGFNIIWGLALWSYLRVSWADPGAVPEEWHDFVRRVGMALPIAPGMKEWQPGKATMCRQCTRPRPERAHHCALCGVCILRLDHHCPWINNCVGFHNHKFFLQTCFYALTACIVAFITALPELVHTTQRLRLIIHGLEEGTDLEPTDEIAFEVFGALAIFISMFLSPLLFIQLRLALNNRTTIEDNYHNMTNPFDQGTTMANLSQIFGSFGIDWFLPVNPWNPILDGITFPSSEERASAERLLQNTDIEELSELNGASRAGDAESKNWAPIGNNQGDLQEPMIGEALWRQHYQIASPNGTGRKPSPLDYMLGCMQMDCDGNAPSRPFA